MERFGYGPVLMLYGTVNFRLHRRLLVNDGAEATVILGMIDVATVSRPSFGFCRLPN